MECYECGEPATRRILGSTGESSYRCDVDAKYEDDNGNPTEPILDPQTVTRWRFTVEFDTNDDPTKWDWPGLLDLDDDHTLTDWSTWNVYEVSQDELDHRAWNPEEAR